MSRIGNAPVAIPEGVEVKLDGQHLTVKGPKGTLERDIHKNITVTIEDNEVKVTRPDDENFNKDNYRKRNRQRISWSNSSSYQI